MENFTPLTATIGGVLIGLASTLLWAVNGRIAGVSTIAARIVPLGRGNTAWRVAFLAGLPLGAFAGAQFGPSLFAEMATGTPAMGISAVATIVAGLLVGIGTRLGGGCTSGHGVCGLARLSPRSFVAVGVFLATAAATVYLARHVVA